MATILIVDDEASVVQALRIVLKSDGHTTLTAPNGQVATEILTNRDQHLDLLVTDIRMTPVDGMELMKLAQQTRPEMPVVVISAYADEQTAKNSFAHGCVAYIKKPFKVDEVLQAVNQALHPSA